MLTISGKNLGAFALPNACPRCLWTKMHMENKVPFSIFPGIFFTIDSYSKKITKKWFELHGELPPWIKSRSDGFEITKVPWVKKFRTEINGVILSGQPDELLVGGPYVDIPDYKTSKRTKNQDTLIDMYNIQLNSYSLISEALGIGKTRKLYLIYYSPDTDITDEQFMSVLKSDGFSMGFVADIVDMPKDHDRVYRLIDTARDLYEAPMPNGNEGCKDCELVDKLYHLTKEHNDYN